MLHSETESPFLRSTKGMRVIPNLVQLSPVGTTTSKLVVSAPASFCKRQADIGDSARFLSQDIQHLSKIHASGVGGYDSSLFQPLVCWELEVVEYCRLEIVDDGPFGGIHVLGTVAIWGIVIPYVHRGEAGLESVSPHLTYQWTYCMFGIFLRDVS